MVLRYLYGGPNWSCYPDHETPYNAGYKTMRTSKIGNLVHVWYPISKSTKVGEDVPWLTHGKKSIIALLMIAFKWRNENWGPTYIFWHLYKLMLNV